MKGVILAGAIARLYNLEYVDKEEVSNTVKKIGELIQEVEKEGCLLPEFTNKALEKLVEVDKRIKENTYDGEVHNFDYIISDLLKFFEQRTISD